MDKIIDWLVSNDSTIIGFFSISLLLIGATLGELSRLIFNMLCTKVFKDIRIREKNIAEKKFLFDQFDSLRLRLDRIDEKLK